METFEAARARYSERTRRHSRGGRNLKHLLSGIARCGKCGEPMYTGGDRSRPVYLCKPGKGHVSRDQAHLDAYVTTVVLDRLAIVDFEEGLDDGEDAAVIEARAEAVELRGRLADATDQFTAGKLSAATLAKNEATLAPKIAAADARSRVTRVPKLVHDLAGEGVDSRWDALGIEQKREVVRALVDITVLPSERPRGSRGFDPDAVKIEWRVP